MRLFNCNFSVDSVRDAIVSALTQTAMKFVLHWTSMTPDVYVKLSKFERQLSISVTNEIVPSLAQPAIKSLPC